MKKKLKPDHTFHNRLLNWMGQRKLSQETLLMVLAIFSGLVGGLGAVAFQKLIHFFNRLAFEDLYQWLEHFSGGLFLLPLIPAVGGLLVGLLVYHFAPEAKGHGVPEVMDAVARKDGVIRPRVVVVKTLASAICIGSGGSVGREGPIVQIGSALGSTVGQFFRLSAQQMRILVGCGAAAGISATFNAPLAGAFFAFEVILGTFTAQAVSPIIIASVVATLVSRTFLGNHPAFSVPAYQLVSLWEVPLYLLLGLLCGSLAVAFTKTLYKTEDIFERLAIPEYYKPLIGGLLVGLIGIWLPQIFGVGYGTVGQTLFGQLGFVLVLGLLIAKLIATSLTIGSGGSGGIFAPSLFLGAMAGEAFGKIVHWALPTLSAPVGAYALVGMSALVAGTTHAPISAILILFEMTDDYRIILPLMCASIFSTLIARKLLKESIYSMKLERRGKQVHRGMDESILRSIPVSEVMNPSFDAIPMNAHLKEVIRQVQASAQGVFPVIDKQGVLQGLLTLQDLRLAPPAADETLSRLFTASDLITGEVLSVCPSDHLWDALEKFKIRDVAYVPVVEDDQSKRVVGLLAKSSILDRYERESVMQHVRGEV